MLSTLKGWLRFKLARYRDFCPFGFAMNGQTARLEVVREIIYTCDIRLIMETGTFRGTTTEWFSEFGVPVYSVESDAADYEFTKRRLANRSNVILTRGDSVEVMKRTLALFDPGTPTLFYLDAHWNKSLPLSEELGLICRHLKQFVVVIDDFEVPDDPGYSYDDYGMGNALTADYLNASLAKQLDRFYPSTPSGCETGAKRGCVILSGSSDLSRSLSKIALLRQICAT